MFDRFKFRIGDVVAHITSPGFPMIVMGRKIVEFSDSTHFGYLCRGMCFQRGDNAGCLVNHEVTEIEILPCDDMDVVEFIDKLKGKYDWVRE